MFFAVCIPYFVICAVHFAACLVSPKSSKVADITKLLLMPCLALTVIVWYVAGIQNPFAPHAAGAIDEAFNRPTFNVLMYLVFALMAGFYGDKFLLSPVTKEKFLKGIFAFFIGHVFYLLVLIPRSQFWFLPWWLVVLFMVVASFIVIIMYRLIHLPQDLRGFGCVVYTVMLLIVNFMAATGVISQFIMRGTPSLVPTAYWISLAGNLSFITSDSILGFTMFVKSFKYQRFVVMLTYTLAQFLLVISLAAPM